jgi:hypothetical protein
MWMMDVVFQRVKDGDGVRLPILSFSCSLPADPKCDFLDIMAACRLPQPNPKKSDSSI